MPFTHLVAPLNDEGQHDSIVAAIRVEPADTISFYWQDFMRIFTFKENEAVPYRLFIYCLAQNTQYVKKVYQDDAAHAMMHSDPALQNYEHCHVRSVKGDITPQDLSIFLNSMAECRDRLISRSYHNQHRSIGRFFNPEYVDNMVAAYRRYQEGCTVASCSSHLNTAELTTLIPASAMANVTALGHIECRYQHWLDDVNYAECMKTYDATTRVMRSSNLLQLPSTMQLFMILILTLVARTWLRALVGPRPNEHPLNRMGLA